MGKIILFDDDKGALEQFKQLFSDFKLKNLLVVCSTIDEFQNKISNNNNELRALIIDLAKSSNEDGKGKYEIEKDIEFCFNNYRVPIFIHSGNLLHYEKFIKNGTVFRIEKSKDSYKTICTYLQLFEESGFIELFSQGGAIESKLMNELHSAFISQFKGAEIKEIISSVETGEKYSSRVSEIFTRIALRALISKLLVPSDENLLSVQVNSTEHYIRRLNKYELWTGDVFRKKDNSTDLVILTPRCDISNKAILSILVCTIKKEDNWSSKTVKDFLTDNTKFRTWRFVPKTPFYEGGKVVFSTFQTIDKDVLLNDYDYLISFSDDLTNDILGKYCGYILRTGIEEINIEETSKFLGAVK